MPHYQRSLLTGTTFTFKYSDGVLNISNEKGGGNAGADF